MSSSNVVNHRRLCVFCGKPPSAKTREHVIPQWLIERTGSPSRLAHFGYSRDEELEPLRFAFNSFVFPACAKCNEEFGKLEDRTVPIMESLLRAEPIGALEFSVLLDWFDKVRIGVWLGLNAIEKNPFSLTPRYFIKQRFRNRDRLVFIYRLEGLGPGLTLVGTFAPSFAFAPVAIGMRVNDLLFINASTVTLCARRLGFPFVDDISWAPQEMLETSWAEGLHRTFNPVLRKNPFPKGGTQIFQPVFPPNLDGALHDADYVKKRTLDRHSGLGGIYIEASRQRSWCVDKKKIDWCPDQKHSADHLARLAFITIIGFQLADFTHMLSIPDDDQERSARLMSLYERIRADNFALGQVVVQQARQESSAGSTRLAKELQRTIALPHFARAGTRR